MSKLALATKGVSDAVAFPGLNSLQFTNTPNSGTIFFPLKGFEAHFCTYQRRNPLKEEIVQFRTRLAPNLDQIFEPGSRNQSYPRAFPLKQSIGAHGCSVQQHQRPGHAGLAYAFRDCPRCIGWRRKRLQHANSAPLNPHAIREGTAGVDGDSCGSYE